MVNEAASSSSHGLVEAIRNQLEIVSAPAVPVTQNSLRVPEHLKQLKPETYKPRLISIGPLHHGQRELQPMEAFKRKYAKNVIEKNEKSISTLIDLTKECEGRLRNDYGMDSSVLSSENLVQIMVIDGAFLLGFMVRLCDGKYEEIDTMAHKKWDVIKSDLFLLENQIPFYYLQKVYDQFHHSEGHLTLKDVCFWFLQLMAPHDFYFLREELHNHNHLLGCLRYAMRLPERGRYTPLSLSLQNFSCAQEVLEFSCARGACAPEQSQHTAAALLFPSCPTISQLHRAGIKFYLSQTRTMEIIYFPHRRILELPGLIIDRSTTRHFANLLALEEFQTRGCYATDYIAMMDYLIDGPEDVRILVKNGILQNFLRDDEAAANLFNEIGKAIHLRSGFYYSHVVQELNAHCKKRWIKLKSRFRYEWMRDLKRDYLYKPWKGLSVLAAIIILGLTITQTVFSIIH